MKLEGTVDIINRTALFTGYGASSKLGRACKGVLQIRNGFNRHSLIISTKKDPLWKEYDIKTIQNIHSRFVHEGIATIEISVPPMNIMLRNCEAAQLDLFIRGVQMLIQATTKNKAANFDKDHPSYVRTNRSLDMVSEALKKSGPQKLESKKTDSLRKSTGSLKRPRSPELSKQETERIKKVLRTNNRELTVRERANYPSEFPSTLTKIYIGNIGLRRIDKKILKLEFLNVLNLSRNRLQCVDQLTHLKCQLRTLILFENEISHLPADFFSHKCFQNLNYVDISKNKLKVLPLSVTEPPLEFANVSGNQLKCLPYNWIGRARGLRTLNVSDNDVEFIPATILGYRLDVLDISKNLKFNNEITEGVCDYVGYSVIPTLFETASEVVMSAYHKRFYLIDDLPISIKNYLKGCKYCMACGKMCLRYQICHVYKPSHSLATTVAQDSGRSYCLVKVIICYKCNLRSVKPDNLVGMFCR